MGDPIEKCPLSRACDVGIGFSCSCSSLPKFVKAVCEFFSRTLKKQWKTIQHVSADTFTEKERRHRPSPKIESLHIGYALRCSRIALPIAAMRGAWRPGNRPKKTIWYSGAHSLCKLEKSHSLNWPPLCSQGLMAQLSLQSCD